MSPQAFFYLVRKLNSVIKKEDTRLPKSITAGNIILKFLCAIDYTFQTSVNIGKRLAITLFFLGKGDSIQTVAWGFRIG